MLNLENSTFSCQHDPILHTWTADNLTISIVNNASGSLPGTSTSAYSSRKFISIDLATKTATLLKEYISPEHLLSPSQGNVQTLSNGDQPIGWGNLAFFSESSCPTGPAFCTRSSAL